MKAAAQPSNRRYRLLVEPSVQLAVALRLIAFWAATTLLTALVTVLLRFFADPGGGFATHLTAPQLWMPSLIAFVVTLPIATLHMIRFSHRFAGPVHRLRNELRSLANGEHRPELTFRKDDYWSDLAIEFNAVAARLRELECDAEDRELEAEVTA